MEPHSCKVFASRQQFFGVYSVGLIGWRRSASEFAWGVKSQKRMFRKKQKNVECPDIKLRRIMLRSEPQTVFALCTITNDAQKGA